MEWNDSDNIDFEFHKEKATTEFPALVRVLGYSAAFEELRFGLLENPMLHRDDVVLISEIAAWSYLNDK